MKRMESCTPAPHIHLPSCGRGQHAGCKAPYGPAVHGSQEPNPRSNMGPRCRVTAVGYERNWPLSLAMYAQVCIWRAPFGFVCTSLYFEGQRFLDIWLYVGEAFRFSMGMQSNPLPTPPLSSTHKLAHKFFWRCQSMVFSGEGGV